MRLTIHPKGTAPSHHDDAENCTGIRKNDMHAVLEEVKRRMTIKTTATVRLAGTHSNTLHASWQG